MPNPIYVTVGEQLGATGTQIPQRAGTGGDQIVSELHGRFYEQAFRGRLFRTGMTLTSISNATFTTATLGATCTPIVGVWNPANSPVNLVILQAVVNCAVTAGTATGLGGLMWCVGTNESAISTGLAPYSMKTLLAAGSQAKGFANTALTGKAANLTVAFGSAITAGLIKNASSVETAVGQNIGVSGISVENFDGSLIVPPGGVLALLCGTTPVAHSAASTLLWEEVPLTY